MEKYVVGTKKILKKEQVLISIFLIAILVLSSGSMVAFAFGHTIVVPPSHDKTGATDTAAIQAALDRCTTGNQQRQGDQGQDNGCTVQLLWGTYYISSQIAVIGFQGSFVGAGQGQTNIVALGNMPSPNPTYNTLTSPFYAAPPGPSNPWPVLFTFVGGSITMSGMTITDTSPTPTLGTASSGQTGSTATCSTDCTTSLSAAILITGLRASAAIDHVSVIGAAGDWDGAWNMANAIFIGGLTLPTGSTNPIADIIPLTGTFSVTNGVFTNQETGSFAARLRNSNVAFCDNTVTAPLGPTAPYGTVPLAAWDVSNTNVLFSGNRGTDYIDYALGVIQGVSESSLSPSTAEITDNNFQLFNGGSGVLVDDHLVPNSLSATISGNAFQYLTPTVPTWVIISVSLNSVLISKNVIQGSSPQFSAGVYITDGPGTVSGNTITGASTGVWVDSASGVTVKGNIVRDSGQYGIALTSTNADLLPVPPPASSNNFIIGNFVHGSGVYDLYWDQATGSTNNHWCGNTYTTSNTALSC